MRRPAASLLIRLLVLVLVWTLTPGLTEAAENAWHLVAEGHVAHAPDAGPEHAPSGDEHGCSGTFHLCSCHPSIPANASTAAAERSEAPHRAPPRFAVALPRDPFLAAFDRPPRA